MAYYGSGLRPAGQLPPAHDALGRRTPSRRWSTPTRRRCRTARGRTGCSATTTGRGSPAASAPAQARAAAVLLLTLRGTPTLYYGDELGMRDVRVAARARAGPVGAARPGQGLGRDPERTPMQWDDGPNAGFCAPGARAVAAARRRRGRRNVAVQRDDPHSMLIAVPRAARAAAGRAGAGVGAYRTVVGRRRRARL